MSSQSPAAAAATSDNAERQAASDVGEGWTIEEVTRKGGKTAGTKDKYWYSPAGKKFRSKAEIGRFKDALATLAGTDEEGDEDKAWKLFKSGSAKGSAKKSTPSSSSAAKSKTKAKSASPTKNSSAKKKDATGTASSSKKKAASTTSAKKKAAAKDGQSSISEAFAAVAAASKQKKKRPAAESEVDDGEEKKEDEDMVMAASSSVAAKAAGSPKKKGRKMVARKSQKAGKPAAAAEKVRVGSFYCLLHGIVILLHLSNYILKVGVRAYHKYVIYHGIRYFSSHLFSNDDCNYVSNTK